MVCYFLKHPFLHPHSLPIRYVIGALDDQSLHAAEYISAKLIIVGTEQSVRFKKANHPTMRLEAVRSDLLVCCGIDLLRRRPTMH